jgi:Ni/Co efflux regulator RcnB
MRYLLPLLCFSAASPGNAADPEAAETHVQAERPARAERPERPSMFERVGRSEWREADRAPARPQAEEIVRPQAPPQLSLPAREDRRDRAERRASAPTDVQGQGDTVRGWRWRERNVERVRRSEDAEPVGAAPIGERLGRRDRVQAPVAAAPAVEGRESRIGSTLRNRIATEGWRREWREDRRYDWRRHRDWDRNRFHVGIYVDPFGWNYRRWNVGWQLPRYHYASRYWINDPWHYRLPPVYGPYRWVRYWDDALLVDVRSGRVVDVIHNFFW